MTTREALRLRVPLVLAIATLALAGHAVAGSGVCAPACEVVGHVLAFAPAATGVASGSTLTWHALDTFHTASDQSDDGDVGRCFHATFRPGSAGHATFSVADGRLFALSQAAGGAVVECTTAKPLEGGGFALDYICAFHPLMTGTLVIR